MVFRTSEFYHKYLSEYSLSHYLDQRLIKWWYFQKEPNEWRFQVPSLGLDITFRIIDDGSIPITYHPDGEKMPLTIQNSIGICMII